MKHEANFQEELEKLELNSAKQALDLNPATWRRSYSSLARQRSELDAHLLGSKDSERPLVYMHNRFSRMTSSPMIKYGRSASVQQQLQTDNLESVSAQVQEKHAQLIESLAGRNSLMLRTKRPHRSLAIKQQLSEEQSRSVTRPNKLMGPLGRDNSRGQLRRKSEEPSSLPYVPYSAADLKSSASKWTPRSNLHLDADDNLSSSPIFRINSSERTELSANDEDDFDITSLLSITVLSDIKTIRLNELQAERHASKQQMMRNSKTLSRARTATDFTQAGRHSRVSASHQHCSTSDLDPFSGPLSLIDTSWSGSTAAGVRPAQEVAQRRQGIPSKQVDESVAHIIAAFKAQVKARASQPTPNRDAETKQTPSCDQEEPTRSAGAQEEASATEPELAARGHDQETKPKDQVKPAIRSSNIPRLIRLPAATKATGSAAPASGAGSAPTARPPLRRSEKLPSAGYVASCKQVHAKSAAERVKEAP